MSRYLVCGMGQVGFRVARLLARLGETVSVTSRSARPDFCDELKALGVDVVVGDARDPATLNLAKLPEVDVVLACTDDDMTNLEIALDTRNLAKDIRIVARIFDQGLVSHLQSGGIVDRAQDMSSIAAPIFAALAEGTEMVTEFVLDEKTYRVTRNGPDDYRVEWIQPQPPTRKAKHPIRTMVGGVARFWKGAPPLIRNLLVSIFALACVSVVIFQFGLGLSIPDALYLVTATLTTTGYGDLTPRHGGVWTTLYGCLLMALGSAGIATLYSMITDFVVSERFNQVLGRQNVECEGHFVVAGLGTVGFRAAAQLLKQGHEVVVIDSESEPKYRPFLPDECLFMTGDARDPATLQRADAHKARGVLAMTSNDAVNLSIAMVAKGMNDYARVVARLVDDRFAKKVQMATEIDAALSASRLAAPHYVGLAIDPLSVFSFLDGDRFVVIRRNGSTFITEYRNLS